MKYVIWLFYLFITIFEIIIVSTTCYQLLLCHFYSSYELLLTWFIMDYLPSLSFLYINLLGCNIFFSYTYYNKILYLMGFLFSCLVQKVENISRLQLKCMVVNTYNLQLFVSNLKVLILSLYFPVWILNFC